MTEETEPLADTVNETNLETALEADETLVDAPVENALHPTDLAANETLDGQGDSLPVDETNADAMQMDEQSPAVVAKPTIVTSTRPQRLRREPGSATNAASQENAANDEAVASDSGHPEADDESRQKRHRETLEKLARIEKEFSDQRESVFQEKLKVFIDEMRQLQEGAHPDFLDQIESLEAQRRESIWNAQLWRDYQLECITCLYEKEKELAEKEYTAEKDGLREKMMEELMERNRKLTEEKDNIDIALSSYRSFAGGDQNESNAMRSVMATRKLRKRAAGDDASVQGGGSNKKQLRRVPLGPPVQFTLRDNELVEDLEMIRRNVILSPTSAAANNALPVSNGLGRDRTSRTGRTTTTVA